MATGGSIYPRAVNTCAPVTIVLKPMCATTVGLVDWIQLHSTMSIDLYLMCVAADDTIGACGLKTMAAIHLTAREGYLWPLFNDINYCLSQGV